MHVSYSFLFSRRSLEDDSVATLVHAFVTSRVDYCGSLLIGAPKKTTDKLQRALNSATRIVSNTHKFDRGLVVISGKVSCTGWTLSTAFGSESVFRCLHNMAPGYLCTLCQPVYSVPGRRHAPAIS